MRLIIVCDQLPATRRLCGELSDFPAEILCVANQVELKTACESLFELALIDVTSADLVECISTIRESPYGANCPVLVASERLSSGTELAGMLPKFRAMPCVYDDLLRLARWLITGGQGEERRRNLRPL